MHPIPMHPPVSQDGTPPYGQQAGGMHPTGILFFYEKVFRD